MELSPSREHRDMINEIVRVAARLAAEWSKAELRAWTDGEIVVDRPRFAGEMVRSSSGMHSDPTALEAVRVKRRRYHEVLVGALVKFHRAALHVSAELDACKPSAVDPEAERLGLHNENVGAGSCDIAFCPAECTGDEDDRLRRISVEPGAGRWCDPCRQSWLRWSKKNLGGPFSDWRDLRERSLGDR